MPADQSFIRLQAQIFELYTGRGTGLSNPLGSICPSPQHDNSQLLVTPVPEDLMLLLASSSTRNVWGVQTFMEAKKAKHPCTNDPSPKLWC